MFEFIGVCFVLFLVFKIAKAIVFGATRGTLFKAIDFAVSYGVPYNFAKKSIDNRAVLKSVIDNLKLMDPNFSTLDVYVQYGMAIRVIYQGLEEDNRRSD